jgi:hypothetical protein
MKSGKQFYVWMLRGPSGGVAPFYGFCFTRKCLLADIKARGIKPGESYKPVRVLVTQWIEKP